MLKDKYSLTFIMGVILQSSCVVGIAITNVSIVDAYTMVSTLYALPLILSCLFMTIGFLGILGIIDKLLNKFKKN